MIKGARGNKLRKFQHFLLCKYIRAYGKIKKYYWESRNSYQKKTEEVVALQEKIQRMEEHKRDTLLESVALEGKQRGYCREILSDEGTEDNMQVKSMEGS